MVSIFWKTLFIGEGWKLHLYVGVRTNSENAIKDQAGKVGW